MKHSTINLAVLVVCMSLIHHTNGLPQAQNRNWISNSTGAYNNRWQQTIPAVKAQSQNQQQGDWQANGGWSWLNTNINNDGTQQQHQQPHQPHQQYWQQQGNKTTANPIYNNNNYFNTNWQTNNGTRQTEGQRLWLNNTNRHHYSQVPSFGNASISQTTEQTNGAPAHGSKFPFGWQVPQYSNGYSNSTKAQPNNWQNFQNTPQPVGNNNWQGANNWNNPYPSRNSTTWRSTTNYNHVTPVNPLVNGNWNGRPSGGFTNPNQFKNNNNNSQNWWNNSGNTLDHWNTSPPSTSFVGGNNNNGNGASALAPIGQIEPFNDGNVSPNWNSGSNNFGYSGGAQLAPLAGVSGGSVLPGHINGASNYDDTPLAPLADSSAWNLNGRLAGANYAYGQRQTQSQYPGSSNPYANLFNT